MIRYVLLLLVALQMGQGVAYAQNKNSSLGMNANGNSDTHSVWRKRVERRVPIYQLEDTVFAVEEQLKLQPFFTRLVDDLKQKTINVYSGFDKHSPISKDEMEDITETHRDTIVHYEDSVDKGTGHLYSKEIQKVIVRKFDAQRINNLSIVEEWTYDPIAGKTEIQIADIGPVIDVYGEEGDYRGKRTIFWMKWIEFEHYLERSQNIGSVKKIDSLIWADYSRDKALVKDSVNRHHDADTGWVCRLLRNTHLAIDTCISSEPDPNLINDYDTTIGEILYNSAVAGHIPAFMAVNLHEGSVLMKDELLKITYIPADTVVVEEVGLGDDRPYRIINHDFNFQTVNTFCVDEEWTFNAKAGMAEISYEAIAPIREYYDKNGKRIGSKVMFWINYADARLLLRRYNEYNPDFNIEWQVWKDRFNEPKRRYGFGRNN